MVLGHVDSRSGPAVFFRLRDLAPGDVVELDLADGRTARYAVERLEQVAKEEFPTFAVFGATADDVLRLMKCTGVAAQTPPLSPVGTHGGRERSGLPRGVS